MSIAVSSTNRPHLARQARLEWDPARKQQVLLAPEGVLVLNQTGATILGLCDGERTVVEIVEELRGKYEHVDGDEVRDFLARLVARRLVELGDE
jgi:pyrroloquinoline quinone biosynthesis protein D